MVRGRMLPLLVTIPSVLCTSIFPNESNFELCDLSLYGIHFRQSMTLRRLSAELQFQLHSHRHAFGPSSNDLRFPMQLSANRLRGSPCSKCMMG